MAATATRPLLIALLLLAFCGQTIAAAAMHCRAVQQSPAPSMAGMEMGMEMHEHHHHDDYNMADTPQPPANQAHADCCSTTGHCVMACSLALANPLLPSAVKMSAPTRDNYLGVIPPGLITAFYKPPIFA